MNIVYAFIGTLPEYCIATVHQVRLFHDGNIFFIVSQMDSPYVSVLKDTYGVTIIPYESVKDPEFDKVTKEYTSKFVVTTWLPGREHLFLYSFERFFILKNLMTNNNLQDVFFLELDNLLYDRPEKWLHAFRTKQMAFMHDNVNRGSSGVCYIRSVNILQKFTDHCLLFIQTYTELLNEMAALYAFWEHHKEDILILPTHWQDSKYPSVIWQNMDLFPKSIFDAAALGIFLGGIELAFSNWVLTPGLKTDLSIVDYTTYKYKWEEEDGKRIPYVCSPDFGWIRINNLHVHSKVLGPMLSKPV